ncbi:MAG: amidase [Betaproteobacteria bacterium]|nr:amidase [Betaproteobacteria bacterium]
MSDDLCHLSAVSLAARIRGREVSCLEVLRAHLARIERADVAINAVVTRTFEQAEADARALDARLAKGESIGPLGGLPVAHKDLTLTRGVRTTFGSPIFQDFVPDVDALLVERLKAAGAVSVVKTNTPEFGAGSQTFNRVFGATRNPWDTSRTCGGSSGGAAAALAAGMVPIADGTDLGGSLRNPASFCNVVGFRGSPGRVPVWPTQNGWFPLGIAGPMARTVADASLMLSVMAGSDARTPIALDESGDVFARPLERDFGGVRVAWSPTLGGLPVEREVLSVLERAVGTFSDLGCVVEAADPDLRDAAEVFEVLRAWYFESVYGNLLATRRHELKQTVIWNIEEGVKLSGHDVGRAEVMRTELFHRMRKFFDRYDFLVCPVVQVLPFPVDIEYPMEIEGTRLGSYIEWMRSCCLISATSLPALSVPAGFSSGGLPVGLQIVGRFRDDRGVLQLGHAFEQATGWTQRRPPVPV